VPLWRIRRRFSIPGSHFFSFLLHGSRCFFTTKDTVNCFNGRVGSMVFGAYLLDTAFGSERQNTHHSWREPVQDCSVTAF
jgi:hypothetical protein